MPEWLDPVNTGLGQPGDLYPGAVGALNALAGGLIAEELAQMFHPWLGIAPDFGIIVENVLDQGSFSLNLGAGQGTVVIIGFERVP